MIRGQAPAAANARAAEESRCHERGDQHLFATTVSELRRFRVAKGVQQAASRDD
jgi:hypothetical protein